VNRHSSAVAPAPPVAPVGEVVGWVLGKPVTLAMVAGYLREHPAPPALAATGDEKATRRWAARSLMAQLVVRHEAARRGLATEGSLPATVATELVGDGQPTPAQVSSYLERNRDWYVPPERRWARHVLCTDEESASLVAERARSGERISDLAPAFSTDPGSKNAGGDLGPLRRGELAGEIEDRLFAAETDEVIGPVRSPFGWHVLVVYAIENVQPAEIASAHASIAADLARRNRSVAYSAWLERRLIEDVTVAPGYDHPAQPGLLDRVHRH
jgi:PPIC-type PPIASE domain